MTLALLIASVCLFLAGGFWEGCTFLGLAILNSADDKLGAIRDVLLDLAEDDA